VKVNWNKFKFWNKVKDGIGGVNTSSGRRWWLSSIGLIVFIFGCWLLFGSGLSFRENALIALMPIITIASGVYFTIKGARAREASVKYKKTKEEKQVEAVANTINICVKKNKDNNKNRPLRVEFVYEENPQGTMIEITNLNKFFYIKSVYYDAAGETVLRAEPWELPDGEFLSPRKYVIPLLMRAYEFFIKYNRSRTKFQQISAGIMLAAFGITSIVFFLVLAG
jgi:hypothetical protein